MNATAARAAISWSGGKDSYAALARVHGELDVVAAVTMFDDEGARSRSHGLRPEVLAAQAQRLGLTHIVGRGSWATYNAGFSTALVQATALGVSHVVFGDIMFDEHRRWAERICEPLGLVAVEPLWGLSTDDLFEAWVESGAEARIVTTRAELLDPSWLGRPLARELATEFRARGVDLCGERGEYHTVVTNAPLFSAPLHLRRGESVLRSGCWAMDFTVHDDAAHQ